MKRRVLIVDDERNARAALAELLAEEGYVVETAADGEKAVAKLESFAPDLVLTDLVMPGMSGFEVVRRARDGHPERVVVVITGHGERDRAALALAEGASAFLTKPVDFNELTSLLGRSLQLGTG